MFPCSFPGAMLCLTQLQLRKERHVCSLPPWFARVATRGPGLSQAGAAQALNCSEGAVKVGIHRLRRRFREAVKAEIAQTVGDPAHVAEELRYLVDVLSQQST